MTSAAMRPILRVGLSALMAYWGTTEMVWKRCLSMAALSEMGSSVPSSSTLPATWRMRPSRRMRLFPSVVLPQPDSPARPMISPSAMSKLTPSRAWTSPARVV